MTPSPSLDSRIRFAIQHKRLLRLAYLGKTRVVEPHDYGVLNAAPKLFVYQLYEVAATGKGSRGWRMLELAKIESCDVLDETFPGTRAQPHQRHNRWDVIYARSDLQAYIGRRLFSASQPRATR